MRRVKKFQPCGNRVKARKPLPVSKKQKLDNIFKTIVTFNK
jgi:hypothetical protein